MLSGEIAYKFTQIRLKLEVKFGDDLVAMRIESESHYFQINSNKTNNFH